MYIPLEPVQSSMISQVGYDEKAATLRIQFHNGSVFDYPIFSPRDWKAFREAESIGKHFHRAIKPVFAYKRVEERELKKPCCDHPGQDTCDEECYPCDDECCPSPVKDESALDLLAEVERAFGNALEAGLEENHLANDEFGILSEALHTLREFLESKEEGNNGP